MQIFSAYNQHNTAEGKDWDTWPEWELVLTSLDDFSHVWRSRYRSARSWWPKGSTGSHLMQFMHGSPAIAIDGYTVTVTGDYGHTFSFDMCIEYGDWVTPGSLVKHYEKTVGNRGGATRPTLATQCPSLLHEGHRGAFAWCVLDLP